MVFRKRVTGEQRALAMFSRHERKYTLAEIAKKTKMSQSSVWKVVYGKDTMRHSERKYLKRGRREKLTARDKRKLYRAIMSLRECNFTVMEVVKRSGIDLL